MPRKILFISVMAVVAAAILGDVLKTRAARREAERDIAQRSSHRAQLVIELDHATQRLAEVEREQTRVTAAFEKTKRRPISPVTSRPHRTVVSPPEIVSFGKKLATTPKMQNAHLGMMRERFIENYRALAGQLHLTSEQAAQLVENVLRRYEQRMDVAFAMETLPPAGSDASVAIKAREEIDAVFRAAQIALLGEASYAKFDVYDRTSPLRRFVDAFAGKAAITGAPITADQADGLVDAMATANASFRDGQQAQMQNFDWTTIMAHAEATLSASQLAAFKNAAIPYWNMDRLRELAQKK